MCTYILVPLYHVYVENRGHSKGGPFHGVRLGPARPQAQGLFYVRYVYANIYTHVYIYMYV